MPAADALHHPGVVHVPPQVVGGVELLLGHKGPVKGPHRGTGDHPVPQPQLPQGLPDADLVGPFGTAAPKHHGPGGIGMVSGGHGGVSFLSIKAFYQSLLYSMAILAAVRALL